MSFSYCAASAIGSRENNFPKPLDSRLPICQDTAMPKTGRERLAKYITRSRQKQYEVAGDLRITESYLSQVLSGRRRPGLDIAVRIETLTGIPVSAWAASKKARIANRIPKQAETLNLARG
jgi:plasmid maintenance system antidote protein VapI